MKYYIDTRIKTDFDDAVNRTKEALISEGFGVLTEIDLNEKFKEKMDVNFRRYKILGSCNPPLAYQAVQIDEHIGLMLPCNVIVQEGPGGFIDVAAIDPLVTMQAVGNRDLEKVAAEVKSKLLKVITKLNPV